ncbi:MAG TPA: thioredoxin family protein [Gemmatimonadaceae bacterium]|nr:thioredoxin family protein [Gemmatimonadaceae bacterium]
MTTPPMHLAYFHAPWCGVCHEKAPVVDDLARESGLELQRWDIEEDAGRAEAERRRIRQVPTLALIFGERVPFRLIGAMITPENVRHLLAMHGPGAQGT